MKAIEDSLEVIPEQFHELYSERNGHYEFTGIEDLKTSADIERLQKALFKERSDHKRVKEQLSELDNDEIEKKLAKLEELEHSKEKSATVYVEPFKRENEKLQKEIENLNNSILSYKKKDTLRTIHDNVRSAISKVKGFQETAIDDAIMYAELMLEINEEGNVVVKGDSLLSPGSNASTWLKDMQEKKPHWWASSVSGGAMGSYQGNGLGVKNPWTKDNWNMTEQTALTNQNHKRAEQLATRAGTKLGGLQPTK